MDVIFCASDALRPVLRVTPQFHNFITRRLLASRRAAHGGSIAAMRGPNGGARFEFTLEFRLIECLARNSGMIVTQAQLLREVWGPDRTGDTRGLRSYVKQLRQKLEVDPRQPKFLLTEVGVGYRLNVE